MDVKTFAIHFYLKASVAKSGMHYLYCRITYRGRRSEFSLQRKVNPDLWDSARSRYKGHTAVAKQVNKLMQQVQVDIYSIYEELKRSKTVITAQLVKERYLGQDQNQQKTVVDAMAHHYKVAEATIRPGTLKNYRSTHKSVKRFMREVLKVDDVYLAELSLSFLTKYEFFLRTAVDKKHPKPMGNNTVMKHIQRLRKIIKTAIDMEWLDKDPFIRHKAHYIKKERAFLTNEELTRLVDRCFAIDRVAYVRDLLVFSCYTGLAYADAMSLTPDNVVTMVDGSQWLHTQRIKTEVPVSLPLLQPAIDVIDKYKDDPRSLQRGALFPKISNQRLNAYLKEIADLCGINKHLTHHVARHTFATTVTLGNGVPIETVSKMLGHTMISTTQIYARVLQDKIAKDMAKVQQALQRPTRQVGSAKIRRLK